jgi:uncharacterized membrane protein YuzA (DUF378 family)
MKKIADGLIILSVIAAVVSGLVSLFRFNLYLAGTQWMLVAIAFGIYGLFIKLGKK